jgi:hypothetical protein
MRQTTNPHAPLDTGPPSWLYGGSQVSSAACTQRPNLVVMGFGVWEAADHNWAAVKPSTYRKRIESTLASLLPRLRRCARSALLLVGNGACRRHQLQYWRHKPRAVSWPSQAYERLVHLGNELIKNAAYDRSCRAPVPILWLNRSASMETIPALTHSACFMHHPNGIMSNLHASLVQRVLGCL